VNQVTAAPVANTNLIEISVVDSNPQRAKVLADAIAQQLIQQSPSNNAIDPNQVAFVKEQIADLETKIKDAGEEIKRLQQELDATNSARQIQSLSSQIALLENKITGWQSTYSQLLLTQGGSSNTVSVLEEATTPTWPISPNTRMNVMLAAVLGLILAVGGALLVEYLDDTIKTPDDAMRTTNLPLLGAITRIDGEQYPDKLIAATHPLSPTVEAYRVIRTNIQFSTVDHPARTLMVTSPSPSEGKSVMLANLAVVMAQSGLKTILVDTDLRRPVQHRIFGITNRNGLSNAVLEPDVPITERLQETSIEGLSLLSSGSLPPNPAELLASERMSRIINELKEKADLVLFDSPPTLVVADAAILGSRMDGAILVNDSGNTRTAESRRAADELRRVRVNLLGVVLNRMPLGGRGSYYYYNYSYYMADGAKKPAKSGRKWFGRQSASSRSAAEKAAK
jgi:non-specific protein-tyrosine kinase